MYYRLALVLLLALVWRGCLIQSQSLAFQSDEAVVALMARHFNQGQALPTFYYGQDYMGSLDALLVAIGFRIGGESVQSIRWVQALLYFGILLSAYALAYEITQKEKVALLTLLFLAVPNMLGTLYTSITLGGYNEIILLGNLVMWIAWQAQPKFWQWLMLGFCAGLGWWINGAIISAIGVAGIYLLSRFSLQNWRAYLGAGLAFGLGSAPWWVYNLAHEWAALDFLLRNESAGETLNLGEKLLAFSLIGFSSLYGLRFPWEASFQGGLAVYLAAFAYLILLADWLSPSLRRPMWRLHSPEGFIWLNIGVLGLVFMLSSFQDATGRYLLPLWTPAMMGLAWGVWGLRAKGTWLAAVVALLILSLHFSTVLKAMFSPIGIQAQLDEALITSKEEDQALLRFLAEGGFKYGYTSYWVSYRTMFLMDETIIFDTSLPYDEQGYRPNNNRYRPYQAAVAEAESVIWVTQNLPPLDAIIQAEFAARQIRYRVASLGVYRVYYDLSVKITPSELGLDSPQHLNLLE